MSTPEQTLEERAAEFLQQQGATGNTRLLADFACLVALPIVRERAELLSARKQVLEEAAKATCDLCRSTLHDPAYELEKAGLLA
jgi:hypothetical protein